MTTSERAGIHQYTFLRENDKKFILIDFDHRDDLIFAEYILNENKHISGQRISKSWAEEQHFYFDLEFSIEPSKIKRVPNKYGHKLLIEFPKQTKILKIAIGISQVDEAGALARGPHQHARSLHDALGARNDILNNCVIYGRQGCTLAFFIRESGPEGREYNREEILPLGVYWYSKRNVAKIYKTLALTKYHKWDARDY